MARSLGLPRNRNLYPAVTAQVKGDFEPYMYMFFGDLAPGRLMAKEIYALNAIFGHPRRPSVFILGGAKFSDVSEMIDRVLGSGMADTVILVGLVGNAYLLARGVDIGEASMSVLKDELTPENLQAAKDILSEYGQRVLLPVDVAVERDGKRVSVNIGDLPTEEPALDIGDASAEKFRKVIMSSKTSFMSAGGRDGGSACRRPRRSRRPSRACIPRGCPDRSRRVPRLS